MVCQLMKTGRRTLSCWSCHSTMVHGDPCKSTLVQVGGQSWATSSLSCETCQVDGAFLLTLGGVVRLELSRTQLFSSPRCLVLAAPSHK